MTSPKQSAIRKAYGEYYEGLKDRIDDNGYVMELVSSWDYVKHIQSDYSFVNETEWEFLDLDENSKRATVMFRPIALRGIENNRGWTRIDGPDDLPKEDGLYMFLRNGEYNMKYRYDTSEDDKQWFVKRFSHWRPVEEIPEPVY